MFYSVTAFLAVLAAASAKDLSWQIDSLTYKQPPEALHANVENFFQGLQETVKEAKAVKASSSLRSDNQPNVAMTKKGYVENLPQNGAAEVYLEKETYIGNQKCHIEYEKNSKPTIYMSHVVGIDKCHLSTFTTDFADPSTFVYVKSAFSLVEDSEAGKSYAVQSELYKDSDCSTKVSESEFPVHAFTDISPMECTKKADGVSQVARKYKEAPARNTRLNKGTSVSLFSSVDDCVSGTGSLQERVAREDNCFHGMRFECIHEDRFHEYAYKMTKFPNADCTETKAREEDPSQITEVHFTRAEGCANVMPLDATVGHPVINCGQHW